MLLGLIIRESTKDRRSLLSWRAAAKGILLKTADLDSSRRYAFTGQGGSLLFGGRSLLTNKTEKPEGYGLGEDIKHEWTGYGFGRQGERAV